MFDDLTGKRSSDVGVKPCSRNQRGDRSVVSADVFPSSSQHD